MTRPQWRASALAVATAVLLGFSASDASALALGRVTVQSALGEPLRAEIEIPEVTAEELASLRATIASPEAFRAAGFEYSGVMANVQITLRRRPDGRHFLHLSSQRPVTDPFVDLVLEATWSSGRVVRDYTMLFDPPNLREGAPAVAAAPVAPAARAAAAPAARTPAPRPAAEPKAASADSKQVTVRSGDTAGRIAAANKPATVSLDQMLVALLQANPGAFAGGNVNRLKAGAVLEVPSTEQVERISPGEARQNIVAQSRDFNEYRRRLAEGSRATGTGGNERQASGRVQAQVEEKKEASPTPDKLTLSKGAVQGKGAADKIARDRAAQDEAARVAELNKNISELNKLGTATAAPQAAGPAGAKTGMALPLGTAGVAKPASAPAAAMPVASGAVKAAAAAASSASPSPAQGATAPAAMTPSATASAVPAAATTSASAPTPTADAIAAAAAASAPVEAGPATAASAAPAATAPAPAASKPRVAPPPPETSLIDDLLENPMVPASVGGVLALLLGFGFYRARQRKKSTQVDSSFLESRLQPDSFFGASGGQRIDTNESNATGSSMVYSPSQLDAAGDVDPVAEADVYLAYGRDLQAEEILKEAMRTTPQRVAVHAKLLEIYSKRRDAKAFELIATDAYALTRGEGPEWDHICALGRDLDPPNPLYRPGGQPPAASPDTMRTREPVAMPAPTLPIAASAAAPEKPADLDLDLDFSIGDEALSAAPPPVASVAPAAAQAKPLASQPMPILDMDFGSTASLQAQAVPELPSTPATIAARPEAPGRNGSAERPNSFKPPSAPAPEPVAQAPAADVGMIEFDLGALSLDLDAAPAAAPAPAAGKPQSEQTVDSTGGAPLSTGGLDYSESGDPLATKLALAQEFNAIGDPDGARSLAEEVLAEASGDLKQKAQSFLAEIA